jgi:hypothetical protein
MIDSYGSSADLSRVLVGGGTRLAQAELLLCSKEGEMCRKTSLGRLEIFRILSASFELLGCYEFLFKSGDSLFFLYSLSLSPTPLNEHRISRFGLLPWLRIL